MDSETTKRYHFRFKGELLREAITAKVEQEAPFLEKTRYPWRDGASDYCLAHQMELLISKDRQKRLTKGDTVSYKTIQNWLKERNANREKAGYLADALGVELASLGDVHEEVSSPNPPGARPDPQSTEQSGWSNDIATVFYATTRERHWYVVLRGVGIRAPLRHIRAVLRRDVRPDVLLVPLLRTGGVAYHWYTSAWVVRRARKDDMPNDHLASAKPWLRELRLDEVLKMARERSTGPEMAEILRRFGFRPPPTEEAEGASFNGAQPA